MEAAEQVEKGSISSSCSRNSRQLSPAAKTKLLRSENPCTGTCRTDLPFTGRFGDEDLEQVRPAGNPRTALPWACVPPNFLRFPPHGSDLPRVSPLVFSSGGQSLPETVLRRRIRFHKEKTIGKIAPMETPGEHVNTGAVSVSRNTPHRGSQHHSHWPHSFPGPGLRRQDALTPARTEGAVPGQKAPCSVTARKGSRWGSEPCSAVLSNRCPQLLALRSNGSVLHPGTYDTN